MAYIERVIRPRWVLNGKRVPANTLGAKKVLEKSLSYCLVTSLPGQSKQRLILKGVTSKEAAYLYLQRYNRQQENKSLGLPSLRPDSESHKIEALLELFLQGFKRVDRSEKYVKDVGYLLKDFFRHPSFTFLSEINTNKVFTLLDKKEGKTGNIWSATTKNKCRRYLQLFGTWCKKEGCWLKNKFKAIESFRGVKVKSRRPLTVVQIKKLIRATTLRPFFQRSRAGKLMGRSFTPKYTAYLKNKSRCRALLYYYLFTSVSRLGAALTLTPQDLELDGPFPCANFSAEKVKKRKILSKPIPLSMATLLKRWIKDKKLKAKMKIFDLGKILTRDFHKDLAFANIPRHYPDGSSVDIHALKTSAISFLGQNGVEGKLLQDIGEHEQLSTTHSHYLRLKPEQYQGVASLFESKLFKL
jgi:site-specific recombinase XerD